MTRSILYSLLLLSCLTMEAQELEKVLLPVVGVVPGAGESQWTVDMWVRNDGPAPVSAFPLAVRCSSPSRCQVSPVTGLAPHTTLSWSSLGLPSVNPGFIPLTRNDAGAILYVERGRVEELRIALHVRDYSKSESNLGAEIRAVREREFRTTPLSLPRIPISPGYRYALRVYDPDNIADASVHVKFFETGFSDTLIWEETLPLSDLEITTDCVDSVCPWPGIKYAPSILYLPLDTRGLFSGSIRIEITPITPGLRFWAMVSATNENTHLVTTYTPN